MTQVLRDTEAGDPRVLEDGVTSRALEGSTGPPPPPTPYLDLENGQPFHLEDGTTPIELESATTAPVVGPAGVQLHLRVGRPTFAGQFQPTVQVTPPSTPDILDGRLPIRTDDFEFVLLDRFGKQIGTLDVAEDSVPVIRADTTRAVLRTCTNVEVYRSDFSQIDVEHERVQVNMILQNGDIFPVGLFMFGQDVQAPADWGTKLSPELFDQTFLIDQPLDQTVPVPQSASIYSIITVLLAPFNVTVQLDVADVLASTPMSFPVGSSRLQALNAVAALLGCYNPYFNAVGVLRFKAAQQPGDTSVNHVYQLGLRIVEEQVQLTNSSYKAPNKYLVISSDAQNPFIGTYTLPDYAPHSAVNRDGRVVTTARTVQGVTSQAVADKMAYVDALTDKTAFGRITFAATADPRHDSYDTMSVLGRLYLETAWELECVSGGLHRHEGTTIWQPTAPGTVTGPSTGTVPGTPTAVTAVAFGSTAAAVSYTIPADGGSPITGYLVTPFLNGVRQSSQSFLNTNSTEIPTGLTGGQTYTFTVAAVNGNGTGPASAQSNPVTLPASGGNVPGAPTGLTAVAFGSTSAAVSYTIPADGGSPITGYVVTPFLNGVAQTPQSFTNTNSTQVPTGLTGGKTYTFTVAAINGNGTGPASVQSSPVTLPASGGNVPGVPTGLNAVPFGSTAAAVTYTIPADGGSPITGYVVTPYISGTPQTAQSFSNTNSTQVPSGLTNGKTYTFTVAAINANGTGQASAQSNPVTLTTTPPNTLTPTGVHL